MIFNVPARSHALMLLGAGLGALTAANPAFSQESAPDAAEIVVTGVRASVGSALELKRTATQLQESIVAEDIGKLPESRPCNTLRASPSCAPAWSPTPCSSAACPTSPRR